MSCLVTSIWTLIVWLEVPRHLGFILDPNLIRITPDPITPGEPIVRLSYFWSVQYRTFRKDETYRHDPRMQARSYFQICSDASRRRRWRWWWWRRGTRRQKWRKTKSRISPLAWIPSYLFATILSGVPNSQYRMPMARWTNPQFTIFTKSKNVYHGGFKRRLETPTCPKDNTD